MKADPAPGFGALASGRSILIVEDHEDAREALRALLELEGHRVDAAGTGPRALELAREHHPEIALIDIGLPDDVKRARDAGFDAHLLKPIDPDALASVLNAIGRATPGTPGP